MPRDQRFRRKSSPLPDVTIADIIGDVDPIRAATRRPRSFRRNSPFTTVCSPRANRGIFRHPTSSPTLAGKNSGRPCSTSCKEGDIQIKGYPLRLPARTSCWSSPRTPEDYTARGKNHHSLKDRIGAEIRTHYPSTLEEGMTITQQEAWVSRDPARKIEVPAYLREVVEEIAFQARDDKARRPPPRA